MTPADLIEYWITTANDDWKAAQILFGKRDYVHALFFGHLYLEKLLKAVAVQHVQGQAPYGHVLHSLAAKAGLELSLPQVKFLERVTQYNLNTRYPDWKFAFKKRCKRPFCERELKAIEEFGKWLKEMLP